MSEDKKATEAKPCNDAITTKQECEVQDRKAVATLADEVSRNMEIDRPGRRRARNQDVLPEILGKQLKAAYSELLNAPVPEAITELIKRLESQEQGAPAASPEKPLREEQGQ